MTTQKIDIVATVKGKFKKLDELNDKLTRINRIQAKATVQADKFTNTLARGLNKSSTEVVRFNGNMLSLLFFGMELKRIFGGALKSIFEGYKKIVPEGSKFNQLTTQLSANWEFFKFQLADALAQSPMFQKMIQFAIRLVQSFQSLSAETKAFLGWLLIAGLVIGTVVMALGLWSLGIGSVINVLSTLGLTLNPITAALKLFGAIFTPTGLILAGLALMAAALHTLYTKTDIGSKKFTALKDAFKSILSSAFNPLMEGLKSMGFNIESLSDLWIYFGAIVHNILVVIGTGINFVIAFVRTLFNIFQVLIGTVWSAFKLIGKLKDFDLDGAKQVWRDWKNNVSNDISDVMEAVTNAAENQKKLNDAWMTGADVNNAVKDFNTSLTMDRINTNEKTGEVSNYYIDVGGGYMNGTPEQNEGVDFFIDKLGISPGR